MTRHEKFKKMLGETLEKQSSDPMLRNAMQGYFHRSLVESLLISIAGSLALIADALNPAAAAEEEENG